ncbi:MAG: glucosaminidase domain-containing protein [Verrucomicrobiota bacterium]
MKKRKSGTIDITPALAVKVFHKERPKKLGLTATLVASNLIWLGFASTLVALVWGTTKVGSTVSQVYLKEKARWVSEHKSNQEYIDKLNEEISRMVSLHTGTPADVVKLASIIESVLSTAQGQRREFLRLAIPVAIHTQVRYEIPASGFLAMSIYESRYGESDLAQKANNFFGIKAFNDWKGDKVFMPTVDLGQRTMAYFRSYRSISEGFDDFATFLSKKRYEKAFDYTNDGIAFVREVLRSGYCPDHDYLDHIKTIMQRHNLRELEKILQKGKDTPYQKSWTTASMKMDEDQSILSGY